MQTLAWLAVAGGWAATAPADRVEVADGRVLDGAFVMLPGVAVDPATAGTGGSTVVMCDDELTRTMVAKRQVVKADPAPVGFAMERIPIPQRLADNGRRVSTLGAILETTPFDEFGRRILSLASTTGRIDIVQGITEITPRWTRVEAVSTEQPFLLDMRVATSSLPRDVLRRVIDQHIDRTNPDHRLRVVRLLLQAERYDDARRELDQVLADFPALENLRAEQKTLADLVATQRLDEIRLRGRSGQDRLAMRFLDAFPVEQTSGELLEEVREERDTYRARQERARRLVAELRGRVARLEDESDRGLAERVVDEMEREMTFSSLDRLSSFERLGLDPEVPVDRAVAIGISGWLQGAATATDNLKVALSSARVRELVRDYLRATEPAALEPLRARLADEEAFVPATVAALARHMRPPLDPPPEKAAGLHELTVPGLGGQEPVSCLVQLPPEYDPLRLYPTVVSLHASWSTPLNQIEWWAGLPGADGIRQGQATRQGMIVVAPAWAGEHQSAYDYSAREHAVVLNALREATKRFAIDTDRVFLSGHSMGGDAAWDIALAHPDLWAGLVAISPAAGKYVNHYWRNAKTLPLYLVAGELDSGCFRRNTMDLDRYFAKGFDVTYVEFRGRGHEHFSDEILRITDWMNRKRRTFFPAEIDAVSMRPWDSFFWWIEMSGAPPRTVVLPDDWPPPSSIRPLAIEGKTTPGNSVMVQCGADDVRVWLAPELVDFSRPIAVTINGRKLPRGTVAPDVHVMLDDLRLRSDRQHPFWAVAR
jgi:predicted esterase